MSACVANTVHAILRDYCLTISCIGSGTVAASPKLPDIFPPNAAAGGDNSSLEAAAVEASSMAFLARSPSTLSPLLVLCYGGQIFVTAVDPSAYCVPCSNIIQKELRGGLARGVVAVEPSQAVACVYGGHDMLLVQAGNPLTVVTSFQSPSFEIESLASSSSSSSISRNASSSFVCVVAGKAAGEIAGVSLANVYHQQQQAKLRFERIEGLEIPDSLNEGDGDVVASHTLQPIRTAPGGIFVWWAVWKKSGAVTACYITASSSSSGGTNNKLRALSPLQVMSSIELPPYIAADSSICASPATGDIAIWSRQSPVLYIASTSSEKALRNGDDSGNVPQVIIKSSRPMQLPAPAASSRCIRGGTFLLSVGWHDSTRTPWSSLVPLREVMTAHHQAVSSNNNEQQRCALTIARSILSDSSQNLNKATEAAQEILGRVEKRIVASSSGDQEESGDGGVSLRELDLIEAELNQLRACRFALSEREAAESIIATEANSSNNSNGVGCDSGLVDRTMTKVYAWDRRLHTAFVLLHVTRLLKQSSEKSNKTHQQLLRPAADIRQRRSQRHVDFLAVVSEELKIPPQLSEFSQWVKLWPARPTIEVAAEHVGVTFSDLVAEPMMHFQSLVEKSMDVIDGCLEWVAFFALYLAVDAGEKHFAAFVSAIKVPPVLIQLAHIARAIDDASAASSPAATSRAAAVVVSAQAAAVLANQTACLPVRRLLTSLFTGLCDSGNLDAAYSMSSALTLSQLLRGDAGAFDRDVVLRLAYLAAQKESLAALSVLLDHAVSVPPTQRGADGQALVLYVIAACSQVAARQNSIEVYEGRLNDVSDQDIALQLLTEFNKPKLRIELFVQSQRQSEALVEAKEFSSTNPVEQHWAGVVTSHLRSIVSSSSASVAVSSSSSSSHTPSANHADAAAASSSALLGGGTGETTGAAAVLLDAEVVRPVPPAFYARPRDASNVKSRCRVVLTKTGYICGCNVPCPYHSAHQQPVVM